MKEAEERGELEGSYTVDGNEFAQRMPEISHLYRS